MTKIEQRNSISFLQIILVSVLFFGGGFGGNQLAKFLAPGSIVAEFVGFFMLPLSMLTGLTIWFWAALTILLSRLLYRLFKNRSKPTLREAFQASAIKDQNSRPGSFFFVPICVSISFVCGVLIGFTPAAGFFSAVFWTTLIGLFYGVLLWRLAKGGMLPLPDEV